VDWTWFLVKLIVAFVIMNVGLVVVAYLVYFERKVAAHMQVRIGPNRAGPIGLFQSFADLIKMLTKETTITSGADRWVFFAAPIIATFAALGALGVLPFGPAYDQPGHLVIFGIPTDWFIATVSVSALIVLALSSLGVYGIIMAGWSSNSKYSLLGGLRSSSQVISYELTLGISLVGVFLLAGSLDLLKITTAQGTWHNVAQPGIWFILLQPVAFIVFLTSAMAETNRTPFDLPEAESELVGGYHTEYSGIRFGLFFLSEYIGMLAVSVVASVCFFGGFMSPLGAFFDQGIALNGSFTPPMIEIPFITGLLASGFHWMVIKISAFIFVYYWARWTLPRFRYDQLMGLCWKVFLPVTLGNIMAIAILKLIFFEPGLNLAAGNEQIFWWVLVVIELIFGGVALYGFSKIAGVGWFGKAERPLLVDRSLIMVRTVQGGRGTIEGEARPIEVTRSSGGG